MTESKLRDAAEDGLELQGRRRCTDPVQFEADSATPDPVRLNDASDPAYVLQLQQQFGNAYVQEFVAQATATGMGNETNASSASAPQPDAPQPAVDPEAAASVAPPPRAATDATASPPSPAATDVSASPPTPDSAMASPPPA